MYADWHVQNNVRPSVVFTANARVRDVCVNQAGLERPVPSASVTHDVLVDIVTMAHASVNLVGTADTALSVMPPQAIDI